MNDLKILQRGLLLELQRCSELFNSQVFVNRSIFTQSAFIELLVRLNYVLQELKKKRRRVTWTDDIQINQDIKDITDLVNNLRNAAVHMDSNRNFISNTSIKFVFNTFVGKSPSAIQLGQKQSLGNEYADDIAFYYGDQRIYLVRHIKKLLEELPKKVNQLN